MRIITFYDDGIKKRNMYSKKNITLINSIHWALIMKKIFFLFAILLTKGCFSTDNQPFIQSTQKDKIYFHNENKKIYSPNNAVKLMGIPHDFSFRGFVDSKNLIFIKYESLSPNKKINKYFIYVYNLKENTFKEVETIVSKPGELNLCIKNDTYLSDKYLWMDGRFTSQSNHFNKKDFKDDHINQYFKYSNDIYGVSEYEYVNGRNCDIISSKDIKDYISKKHATHKLLYTDFNKINIIYNVKSDKILVNIDEKEYEISGSLLSPKFIGRVDSRILIQKNHHRKKVNNSNSCFNYVEISDREVKDFSYCYDLSSNKNSIMVKKGRTLPPSILLTRMGFAIEDSDYSSLTSKFRPTSKDFILDKDFNLIGSFPETFKGKKRVIKKSKDGCGILYIVNEIGYVNTKKVIDGTKISSRIKNKSYHYDNICKYNIKK